MSLGNHETRFTQHSQVSRHCRPSAWELVRDLAGATRASQVDVERTRLRRGTVKLTNIQLTDPQDIGLVPVVNTPCCVRQGGSPQRDNTLDRNLVGSPIPVATADSWDYDPPVLNTQVGSGGATRGLVLSRPAATPPPRIRLRRHELRPMRSAARALKTSVFEQ